MKNLAICLFILLFVQCGEHFEPDIEAQSIIEKESIKELRETPNEANQMVDLEVKNLDEYKNTVFVPTLESKFNTKYNAVYAVSLLMAWDEIKNQIGTPIEKIQSEELVLMNNSNSYHNVLAKNEYKTSVEVMGSRIKAKAFFYKTLPYKFPLSRYNNDLTFGKSKVVSFGCKGENPVLEVVYYTNDNDFAIRLFPEDYEHEIILMKTPYGNEINIKDQFNWLDSLNKEVQKSRRRRVFERHIDYSDLIKIPVLEFDIDHNFENVEGTDFSLNNNKLIVDTVYQRVAFVMDENGAVVESESEMYAEEAVIESKPKRIIFDSPYFIFLKRKDAGYPYFAMFVANDELMIKE